MMTHRWPMGAWVVLTAVAAAAAVLWYAVMVAVCAVALERWRYLILKLMQFVDDLTFAIAFVFAFALAFVGEYRWGIRLCRMRKQVDRGCSPRLVVVRFLELLDRMSLK